MSDKISENFFCHPSKGKVVQSAVAAVCDNGNELAGNLVNKQQKRFKDQLAFTSHENL
jgi:hypothetical protein